MARVVTPPGDPGIDIRPLSGFPDYEACVALQQQTWGPDFRECVPPAILMISQKMGGVAAGAFDASGALVGFVYGITGWVGGEPCHWSHMLAVRPDLRDRRLGRRLKAYQRERLLDAGVRVMYWTFDPLVARNARLNLMKLGADVWEYVADMYGSNETSSVDSVIGTDRFIVRWRLEAPTERPSTDADPPPLDGAPLVNATHEGDGLVPSPPPGEPPAAPRVHVAVPADIHDVKQRDPSAATAWRACTRRAFQWYLGRGYRVGDFVGGRGSTHHYYRLDAPPPSDSESP